MKDINGFPYGTYGTNRSFQQDDMSENRQFDNFEATELYCPTCKMALPVRKNLLLVLPDGELYEYRCARCGTSVGHKTETNKKQTNAIVFT